MSEFYRYEDTCYAPSVDEFNAPLGKRHVVVALRRYEVLRATPKGAWIDVWGAPKFVLLSARKRFACPTIEEAKASFIARKRRQIRVLSAQLHDAKIALSLAASDGFEALL